jgi:hypothetical protein
MHIYDKRITVAQGMFFFRLFLRACSKSHMAVGRPSVGKASSAFRTPNSRSYDL